MQPQFSDTQPLQQAASPLPPAIRVEECGPEETVIGVDGLLKFDTVDAVKREIENVIAQAPAARLTLDCSMIEFVDSQALAMLIAVSRRCRQGGGELALRNPRPMVQKLLHMTRMDSLFTILQTVPSDAPSASIARVPLRQFPASQ